VPINDLTAFLGDLIGAVVNAVRAARCAVAGCTGGHSQLYDRHQRQGQGLKRGSKLQNAGAATDARHIDGLSVVIEVPGIYLLTLTSTEAGLRFVPLSTGKSDLINFLPVAGSTVFKVKARNAPTVLRFRHSDLRAAELQPYSIIADAQLIRGRRTSQLWKFTTATRETFKLVTIKSRGDDVEAMLRAAAY
jgi:hypothetical protein